MRFKLTIYQNEKWADKNIACEQNLHLGDIVKSWHARGTLEETRKWGKWGGGWGGVGGWKEELASTTHKFLFPPWKPQNTAKCEKCHRKFAAGWKSDSRLSRLDSQWRIEFIYLLNHFRNSISSASKQCFWPLICLFVHWTLNFNVSAGIRIQYFDSLFVYIWKVVHIQKTKLPVAITNIIIYYIILYYICPFWNWRTVFSWTWFSYILLKLLATLSIVLLDNQVLILH